MFSPILLAIVSTLGLCEKSASETAKLTKADQKICAEKSFDLNKLELSWKLDGSVLKDAVKLSLTKDAKDNATKGSKDTKDECAMESKNAKNSKDAKLDKAAKVSKD